MSMYGLTPIVLCFILLPITLSEEGKSRLSLTCLAFAMVTGFVNLVLLRYY